MTATQRIFYGLVKKETEKAILIETYLVKLNDYHGKSDDMWIPKKVWQEAIKGIQTDINCVNEKTGNFYKTCMEYAIIPYWVGRNFR